MKTILHSFLWRVLRDQSGQTLPMAAGLVMAFLGMGGLTIDAGHAYVVRGQLQNSTNAAALAAAGEVYNTSSTDNATNFAYGYGSAAPGDQNYTANLTNVQTTVTPLCLNMLLGGGSTCGSTSPNNAIKVKQTASVPTYFMKLFGVGSLTVSATAIASMQGSAEPWNVAIVLDATGSMNSKDSYCNQSNSTAEQCAMTGIQTMLKGVQPCSGSTSNCHSSNANALFRVSLFSFPNIKSSLVHYDYDCKGTPTAEPYTLPVIPTAGSTAGYTPITYTSGSQSIASTYQITPANVGDADANGFLSDYYVSQSTLNSSSILVQAVGNGSTKGCLKPPSGTPESGTLGGGSGSGETYFAGAIYAAQAALQAEQAAVAQLGIKTRNAIIFVSDGQANTPYAAFPQVTTTASTGGIATTYYKSGNLTKNLTGTAATFGLYPDFNDPCQQAMMAAQYAMNAGTRMYAVAYGSESSGCTDTTFVATGSMNVSFTSASQVIPCLTMENMASPGQTAADPWYFYTDGSSQANGCKDSSHTSTNLGSIFSAIVATFTKPQLLPNNAT